MNRRTLLRGAGVAMALPWLEAMSPAASSAFASAEQAAAPVRMACVFFPNGAIMPKWKPSVDEEGQLVLSPTLEPLETWKSKINVIAGLAHDNGRAKADGAGDHARGGATFLTAARPVKTSGNIRLGISVDQVAATALSDQTQLPSIELGLLGSRNAGSCDSGYSCAYSSNISWRNTTQPMPKEIIPRAAFERLFGGGENKMKQRAINASRQSILDVVSGDAKRLLGKVGGADKRKLDEYFTGVREIERRIQRTEQADAASMPDLEVPMGRPEAFREHVRLMYDIMTVAFETDTTRVATLMLDTAGGNRRYTEVGVKGAHHQLSHHRNREETVADIEKIDRYLVEQFAYFLERLDQTDAGGGRSLLDQSMVLYGSGLSDGNRHRHEDLPIVLAGSAGGQFKTGRYITPESERPMANLFLSMLDAMGTPAESIGDSTGRLTELA
ncbi:MAG: DUF1552 domain-containing protein [Planctomycetota bacterium]